MLVGVKMLTEVLLMCKTRWLRSRGHLNRALRGVGGMGRLVDLSQRDPLLPRDPDAVIVFGAERRRSSVEPAELPFHGAEGGLDRGRLAVELMAADLVAAN